MYKLIHFSHIVTTIQNNLCESMFSECRLRECIFDWGFKWCIQGYGHSCGHYFLGVLEGFTFYSYNYPTKAQQPSYLAPCVATCDNSWKLSYTLICYFTAVRKRRASAVVINLVADYQRNQQRDTSLVELINFFRGGFYYKLMDCLYFEQLGEVHFKHFKAPCNFLFFEIATTLYYMELFSCFSLKRCLLLLHVVWIHFQLKSLVSFRPSCCL